MANRIKGITIEIDGETKGLDAALKGVNKTISSTQTSLKDVERLLKLNPTNTELLAQKQKLLQQQIETTEDKLKALKEANEEVSKSAGNYEKWKAAYTPVQTEIDETKKKITNLETEMKGMEKAGQINTEGYKKLQTEVEESRTKLKGLQEQAKQVSDQFGNPVSPAQFDALQREIIETENRLDSLKEASDDVRKASLAPSLDRLGNSAKGAAEKITPLSKAAGGLMTAAAATVPATEELRSDLSKLDQNARESGAGIDATREAFKKFNVVSDETDSSVEATSNLLQAGFTESNLQKAVEGLSGAYLRFPDTMKIESLADSLQETLATGQATGQFGELLDRLGIGAENFSKGLQNCATDAEKQNYALQTLADAGLIKTYNGWKKNNKELVASKESTQDFQTALADFAAVITPIITAVTSIVASLLNTFNGMPQSIQKVIIATVAFIAAASPMLSAVNLITTGIKGAIGFFSKASNVIGTLGTKGISAFKTLGTAISTFGKAASTIMTAFKTVATTVFKAVGTAAKGLFTIIMAHPIIAIITAIIAAVILLYNKCKWFRDGVNAIIQKVIGFFKNFGDNIQNIKNKVVTAFTNMVSSVKNKVGNIKDAIVNGFNKAINFITSLPGKAITWGRDFIQGLIDGIKSKIQGIIDTVKGIGSKIAEYLHFSRPDKGPLHEYETWMPDFMQGLAKGIKNNESLVIDKIQSLSNKMSAAMNPNAAAAPAVSVDSYTTVMIGNRQFEGYIVKTATKGIGKIEQNRMRAKGKNV